MPLKPAAERALMVIRRVPPPYSVRPMNTPLASISVWVCPAAAPPAVYPGAAVDMDARRLTLKPSRPPVAPKVVSLASRRPPT